MLQGSARGNNTDHFEKAQKLAKTSMQAIGWFVDLE